jgi:hypothetical protein
MFTLLLKLNLISLWLDSSYDLVVRFIKVKNPRRDISIKNIDEVKKKYDGRAVAQPGRASESTYSMRLVETL